MLQITVPEPLQNCCLTLGNFDGVHRGHRQILSAVRRLADDFKVPAVAVTFSPHPLALLRPGGAPPVITSIAERTRLLLASGVDRVFVLPVTAQLLQMTAVEFFDSVLVTSFSAQWHCGGAKFSFWARPRRQRGVVKDAVSAIRSDVRRGGVPG
ncbi:MAG UNVERIFIED_CONTAM: hypothetical protein LVR18_47810 [Planctomycetaceae bacterium]|jgi:riboflavin kinase/FMN adenylyltransferase